jgi:Ca-activated chloride channel family protein
MPQIKYPDDLYEPPETASIRDLLEQQAWRQNPGLARRLAARVSRRLKSRKTGNRRVMHWKHRTLLSLAVILASLLIIRMEAAIAQEQTGQPIWGLLLHSDSGAYTQLAIDTDVQIDITGLIARVEITQQFSNSGSQWAEGTYRFPLPQGAAVDRMRIRVGERIREGEIQEKETARRVYQQARDNGQTATLVEQQRRNQFETRLANIGPGEAIEVTISYLQNISYSDFSYHLRIPMTFTPRWTPGRQHVDLKPAPKPQLLPASNSNDHALSLRANLASTVEFAAIESRYHDVDIQKSAHGYHIELLDPYAVADRDFELSWTAVQNTAPSASLSTYYDGESVYAQLMLAPPLEEAIVLQAREVILIIDTSGSMEGPSLSQAKAALLHALKSFGPDDRFNLMEFNSETDVLFDRSVPVNHTSLDDARRFIRGLSANGGTNMAPALKIALGLPELEGLMRQVVFITDGAVGNEADVLKMVAGDLGDSRMFTVAIGHAPNSWFMRKVAEIGRGSHVHIAKPDEVKEQMSALWGRIQVPALTDICVDWGGSAEYYPEIIPDLYAGEPLWLIARLDSEPTMIGLCGRFNDRDWDLTVNGWDVASGIPGGDNLAILWARKKIEALEDGLLFGADRELTELEITSLALDHGLLTRHTSMVAVDKTPRRSVDDTLAQSNVRGLLPAGASATLANYPSTATGWLAQLLLSLFVLLLATLMLWFSGSRLPSANLSSWSRPSPL